MRLAIDACQQFWSDERMPWRVRDRFAGALRITAQAKRGKNDCQSKVARDAKPEDLPLGEWLLGLASLCLQQQVSSLRIVSGFQPCPIAAKMNYLNLLLADRCSPSIAPAVEKKVSLERHGGAFSTAQRFA